MIIDSHHHLWQYNPIRDTWIDESMKILKKDFLPADLEPILKENKIDASVVVQADQSESETQYLLNCAQDNDFIKGVVGWVDLMAYNVEQRLEHFADNKWFKGIRHIVQDEPEDDFMLRSDFQNGISYLSKLGLTYDILIYPRQLPAAVELARKFPKQNFVMDHIGKPIISKSIDPFWRKEIKNLAQFPNVYCKLSGMITETKNSHWEMEDFVPFLDEIIQAFGTDRVIFGSDWPVCLLAGDYNEVLAIVRHYISEFSDTEKQNIMGLNALKFYALENFNYISH